MVPRSIRIEYFAKFAEDFGFEHITSSLGFPRSNGKAESAMKAANTLMMTSIDAKTAPYLELPELRNMPTEKMEYSSVQSLCDRRTRTKLLIHGGRETAREEGTTHVLLRQRDEGTKITRKRTSCEIPPTRESQVEESRTSMVKPMRDHIYISPYKR